MKRLIIVSIFLVFLVQSLVAQMVTISGKEKDYANSELVFYTLSDFITQTETEVAKCKVQSNGEFSMSFPLSQVTYARIRLGIYKGEIYLEPNKTYSILLPKRQDKTTVADLNPYFTETEFYVPINNVDSTELNQLIQHFDARYQDYVNHNFKAFYNKQFRPKLEAAITKLDSVSKSYGNVFFEAYKKYKFAELRHSAYLRDESVLISKYFANQPIMSNNPAYYNLFNSVFKDYFVNLNNSPTGKDFPEVLASKDYPTLKTFIAKNPSFSRDSLLELSILKGLTDGYYTGGYPSNTVLSFADQLARTSSIAYNKNAALNLKAKITKLMAGYEAPLFTLSGKDTAKSVSLSSLRGKFVYLCFYNTISYACLEQIKLLKSLSEKYKKDIEVVVISCDDDFQKMLKLAEKEKLNCTFLHYKQQKDVLKKYDVKVFPTYFMIDPEGKLAMSPAPSPTENFDERFAKLYIARHQADVRKTDNKNKNQKSNNNKKKDNKSK